MHLDVSRNNLTDEAIRSFAELISKFDGFRSINMMSVRNRMNKKDTGYIEIAKALKENRSIVELDLRENEINESSLHKIFDALEHNFVLSTLRIDTKQKHMPKGFSSYALQSMYEFSISMEEISLSTLVTEE